MKSLRIIIFTAALSTLIIIGCDNSTDPQKENFALSVKSESVSAKTYADSLIIDSVKILVRDLKIKAEGSDSLNLKSGPFVVSFTPDSEIKTITLNRVNEGKYLGAAFSIHKLENSETPPDPDFKDSADDRYSVIITGRINDSTFVYKSEKSAKQTILFDKPVDVDEDMVNVTLVAAPYTWFRKNGTILDPRVSSNRNDIDNLIKDSFKRGFVDNNKDGIPD